MQIIIVDLFRNLPRSAVIIITMAVGALSMSSVLFLGSGATSSLWAEIDEIIGSRLEVLSNHISIDPKAPASRINPELEEQDLRALQMHVKNASLIAPVFIRTAIIASTDFSRGSVCVEGIPETLLANAAYEPVEGRALSKESFLIKTRECLISYSTRKYMFKGMDVIGKAIFLEGTPYTIVGVIRDIPTSAEWALSRVVIPIETARMAFGKQKEISSILIFWDNHEYMEDVVINAKSVMDMQMPPQGYFISLPLSMLEKRRRIIAGIAAVGFAEAILCILVAAGGIMNVLLASVVQRTREFGIRLTCGAENRDILTIVLGEAFMLSLCGSSIGVGAGTLLANFLSTGVVLIFPDAVGLTPEFPLRYFIIPLLICCATGVAAGIVPAIRVYRLDVLTSLKAE